MKKFILVLALFLIPFCFAGCSIAEFNSMLGLEKTQETLSPQEQQLKDEVLDKITILENLSRKYNTEKSLTTNPVRRVMIYIRSFNYNSTYWNLLGGNIESDFETYLIEQQGQIFVDSVKALNKNYPVPTLEDRTIDFVHMFATMNLVYNNDGSLNQSNGDLGGWGGDMCQLAKTLKADSTITELTHNSIKEKASEYIVSEIGGFNKYDLYADIDAYNIAREVSLSTKSTDVLATAIKNYYYKKTASVMKSDFLTNCITESYNTYTNLFNRLKNNLFISAWCSQAEISTTDDALYFEAGCDAFLEYLSESK